MKTHFIKLQREGRDFSLNINHLSAYSLDKYDILTIHLIGGISFNFNSGEESLEAVKKIRLRLINGE